MIQLQTNEVAFGQKKIVMGYLIVSLVALAVGGLFGPFQALEAAKINLYPFLSTILPFLNNYYHGLTLHGVLLVLVWTTFFIGGFTTFMTAHSLGRPLHSQKLEKTTFYLMLGGLLLAAYPLITNKATVMFTSYPPMQAHPLYYIGLALVVVGTWLITANVLLSIRDWRRVNPGTKTPVMAFALAINMVMWSLASVGIAVEFVGLLIPWSLGLTDAMNPLFARGLFWLTGHPIVYFWLLPAYASWYFLVPGQAGGRLFSEPLARLAFLLFIPLSIPVGFHHMYTDPGVSGGWKLVHGFLTFAVYFPSALTMFTVTASLEIGGRLRGGTGLIAWFKNLPWGDASVAAQILSMILFAVGGISGLINASYNLNLIVHNTLWVVGHFHLTVGSAVTLTFMGISYWLVPHLTGKRLWSNKTALWQAWTWFLGMVLMGRGQHWLGLLGAPRRTMLGVAPYYMSEWTAASYMVMVGGLVLFASGFLYLLVMVMTLVSKEATASVPVPETLVLEDSPVMPSLLDGLRPWITITVVVSALAWVPALWHIAATHPWTIQAVKFW